MQHTKLDERGMMTVLSMLCYAMGGFQGWLEFARLAYPAALMETAESLCWGGLSVFAGLLPEGADAVSAVAVALTIYGLSFMPTLGFMIGAATRYRRRHLRDMRKDVLSPYAYGQYGMCKA